MAKVDKISDRLSKNQINFTREDQKANRLKGKQAERLKGKQTKRRTGLKAKSQTVKKAERPTGLKAKGIAEDQSNSPTRQLVC